ncbi:MAG: hypothetical protein Q7S46_04630 [Gallionella sp.]|nr:hypothetical protein [Gallionella sp.]
MQSDKTVLRIPLAGRDTPGRSFDTLPADSSSSPKSPKFNELLARHNALQMQGSDSSLPVKTEGKS